MDPREILDYLFTPEGIVLIVVIVLLLISLYEPQYTLFNAIIIFLIVVRYIKYREENYA